jgi:HPt (histidine-containing phosphotransfer) domain-containing protein
VVAFSSYDDDLVRRRCRSAGFDDYLSKPAARERVYAILHGAAAGGAMASPYAAVVGGTGGGTGPGPDDPVTVSADLHDMLPKFFDSRIALLAELHAALDAGERETAGRIAHKLGGGFGLYGFAWAAIESRALQRDAAFAGLAALSARCGQLQRHIARVRLELHR